MRTIIGPRGTVSVSTSHARSSPCVQGVPKRPSVWIRVEKGEGDCGRLARFRLHGNDVDWCGLS